MIAGNRVVEKRFSAYEKPLLIIDAQRDGVINMEYKNININKKSSYISFMSPTQKNKKGHTRQMTKSIKNIMEHELERILCNTNELLENYEYYSKDYQSFLEATDKFDGKAIAWVFDKTDIINKYNQEIVLKTIENKIPIRDEKNRYVHPATLLVGASGSGKTTLTKQLIGSVGTDFPATMQSNTTVGSLFIVSNNDCDRLVASIKLVNKSALEERVQRAYLQIIKKVLTDYDNNQFVDCLFDGFTVFDDKKVKLQYILSEEKLITEEFVSMVKEDCMNLWNDFLKSSSALDFHVSKIFRENSNVNFFEVFDEFAAENIDNTLIIDKVVEIVEFEVCRIIGDLLNELNQEVSLKFSMEIMSEKNIRQILNSNELEFPKLITLSLCYKDDRKPDNELRQVFFRIMEYISSANELRCGNTLFPLVEQIRIRGNFKPLWRCEDNIEDYILIDSEGIGHDITNQSVSLELRETMSLSNSILFVQNAAEQMQTAFAQTLKTLIYNGWIRKTVFCFNRMEAFDSKAHSSIESKLIFLKSNIKNVIKQIVAEEKNEEDMILSGREHIFEKIIEESSFYFEYLREQLSKYEGFIPEEKKSILSIQIDENVRKQLEDVIMQKFTDKFHPMKQIDKLLGRFTLKYPKLSEKDIALMALNPKYSADMFSAYLNYVNNNFVKIFLERINSCPWQSVKAFNIRIANNWDGRGWRELQPEGLFIELANRAIMSYMLNPENLNEINEKNGYDFIMIIQQIVSEELSISINGRTSITNIAKKTIYDDLLESCWEKAIEFRGSGSTYTRKELINTKITNKFYVNYEKGQRNFLYKEMVDLVFDNSYVKSMNSKYK